MKQFKGGKGPKLPEKNDGVRNGRKDFYVESEEVFRSRLGSLQQTQDALGKVMILSGLAHSSKSKTNRQK